MSKEQSEKAKEISRKVDLVLSATALCNDGCERAVNSFNQLLSEILNTRIHQAQLIAFQNVELDDQFTCQLEIMYGTPNGPCRNIIGKIKRAYPIPTSDELCAMISAELNRQLADINSPLLAVMATIRSMEQAVLRQNILRK